jgi:hypothetical protein
LIPLEHFLIAALAVYRLSLLISKEAGPFDMFGRFRTWAGVEFDQYSNPYATNQFAEGLLCPFCVSVWLGFCGTIYLFAAWLLKVEEIAMYPLIPFALSGIAVYLFRVGGV